LLRHSVQSSRLMVTGGHNISVDLSSLSDAKCQFISCSKFWCPLGSFRHFYSTQNSIKSFHFKLSSYSIHISTSSGKSAATLSMSWPGENIKIFWVISLENILQCQNRKHFIIPPIHFPQKLMRHVHNIYYFFWEQKEIFKEPSEKLCSFLVFRLATFAILFNFMYLKNLNNYSTSPILLTSGHSNSLLLLLMSFY